MINALNEMRSRLIREGRYTDAVDELIVKICDAKTKKFKIVLGVCVMEKSLFEQSGGTYRQAGDMFFRLVKQMSEREGVSERLKTENPMEWVARMNNI